MQEKEKIHGVLISWVVVVLCTTALTEYRIDGEREIAYDLLLEKKVKAVSCNAAKSSMTEYAVVLPKDLNNKNKSANNSRSPNSRDRNGCSHMPGPLMATYGISAFKRRSLRGLCVDT